MGTACLAVSALAGPEARPLTLRAPLWLLVLLALGSVSVWGVGHRFDTERRIEQLGTHLGSAFGPS